MNVPLAEPEAGLIVAQRGAVALLTIAREQRRNAIDAATAAQIDAALTLAESDPATRVIVLTGWGERAFCSSMDLKEAAEIGAGHGFIEDRGFAGITERVRRKPLIAAVNGAAVAGGFEIALACDIVIAADHAVFGLSEVRHGMHAFAGGIQRLAHAVPRQAALAMILTGDLWLAERLLPLGIITEVVPSARLLPRAMELADQIAAYDADAVTNGLALYDQSRDMTLAQALAHGRSTGMPTLSTPAIRSGIRAFTK